MYQLSSKDNIYIKVSGISILQPLIGVLQSLMGVLQFPYGDPRVPLQESYRSLIGMNIFNNYNNNKTQMNWTKNTVFITIKIIIIIVLFIMSLMNGDLSMIGAVLRTLASSLQISMVCHIIALDSPSVDCLGLFFRVPVWISLWITWGVLWITQGCPVDNLGVSCG